MRVAAHRCGVAILATFLAACTAPDNEQVTIAVSANFLPPAQLLEAGFEAESGHDVTLVSGSSGQLTTQILNGAPFDVLLAADQERPRILAARGVADSSSQFTYAIGRLALWSADPERIGEGTLEGLADTEIRWLAIAEPETAPYGSAARQVLEQLAVADVLESRLVRGQNIAQTFALAETGNADIGFIALSQALGYAGAASYVVVPADLHEPIRQDAILLARAQQNAAARAFLEYLRSPKAIAAIENAGYEVPEAVTNRSDDPGLR